MMQRRRLAVAICLALAVGAVAIATAVEKETQEAKITAEKLKANWGTGVWEFTGNCRAEIKGPDKGIMTAPKMTGKFDKSASRVSKITAAGPVSFDITTRKDAEGVQRKIIAKCTGEAVYEGATRTVTLTGKPEVVMTTIPSEPGVRPATFTGSKLIINLKALTIEGDDVDFNFEFPAATTEKEETG